MKKSIRIYISGRIHGVFFISFIKENAEKLELKGFVRNLEDGRIEVFLEGNPKEVKKMETLIKKGPKNCKVENLEIKEERFQDIRSFKVLHI